MARDIHTPDDIDKIAGELHAAAETLIALANQIRQSGMPHSLIHSGTLRSVYLPQVLDWIDKAKADSNSQIRSYTAGVQSKAEFHQRQNANRKKSAAKKATKKKA